MAAKARFGTLDGLRGLAAMFVVFYHYVPPSRHAIAFGHGYLAVDFFFVLSGFVICHAYDDRLRQGMSTISFGLRRVIRLYPLVVIAGLGAGSLALIQHWLWGLELPRASSVVLAALLLPDPLGGQGDLFPLNSPLWSLFLEMMVNLLYAAFAMRLSNRALAIVTASLTLLIILQASQTGSLNVGSTGATLFPGFVRTAASFGIGVLIGRLYGAGNLLALRIPMGMIVISLASVFVTPDLGSYDWPFDIIAAYVLFPVVIIAGLSLPVHTGVHRLSQIAGDLSYPLYVIHFPVRTLIQAVVSRLSLSEWAAVVSEVAIAIAISWAILHSFDQPARAWLSKRLLGSGKSEQRS